jgi:apolipoprotein N-acyltransferase
VTSPSPSPSPSLARAFARRPWTWTVALSLVGGAATALAHSRLELWPGLWLAPVAVVAIGLGGTVAQRIVGAVLLGAVGSLGLVSLAWVPALAAVMMAFRALVLGAALACVGFVGRRLPLPLAALVYPAVVVASELAQAHSPLGTAMADAYPMHDATVLIQLAAVTGASGLSFLAAWAGSAFGLALWQPESAGARRAFVAAVVAVVAVILGGVVTLRGAVRDPGDAVTVAAVHAPSFRGKPEDLAANRERVAAYAPLVEQAADAGATIVVWPEMILSLEASWTDSLMADLADLARGTGAWQVIGFSHRDRPRNTARMIDPAGRLRAEYQKTHLVTAMERSAPGTDPAPVVDAGGVALGVLICNDDVFTGVARQLGRDGAEILADPTWDWEAVAWRHAQITRLRAVENRVAIIRATQGGISQLIDAYGRVLAEHSVLADPEQVLVGGLPPGGGGTVYGRVGDAFSWAIVGMLGLLVAAASARRRASGGEAGQAA